MDSPCRLCSLPLVFLSYLEDCDLDSVAQVSDFWAAAVKDTTLFGQLNTIDNEEENPTRELPSCDADLIKDGESQLLSSIAPSKRRRPRRILIVGDGDLSFSLALCRLLPLPTHSEIIQSSQNTDSLSDCSKSDDCEWIAKQQHCEVVATCYGSKEDTMATHPHCESTLQSLKDISPGITVLFGVDATDLSNTLTHSSSEIDTRFDQCIFNFPHHCGPKGKIQENRRLLKQFFSSVRDVIVPYGEVLVRLCFGQGGTSEDLRMLDRIQKALLNTADIVDSYHHRCNHPAESIPTSVIIGEGSAKRRKRWSKLKPRVWGDTWKIIEQAAHNDFFCCDIRPFVPSVFSEYRCTGRKGSDAGFMLGGSLTHVFMLEHVLHPSMTESIIKSEIKSETELKKTIFSNVQLCYGITYFRDISFWTSSLIEDHHINPAEFILNAVGRHLCSKVEFINEFIHPITLKKSYCYRVWYQSDRIALCPSKCNKAQSLLRSRMRDELGVGIATAK